MDKTNWDNKFEVGDEVEAFGNRGTVLSVGCLSGVTVIWGIGETSAFCHDGRFRPWCKDISLKFVSRKDKLYWLWLFRLDNGAVQLADCYLTAEKEAHGGNAVSMTDSYFRKLHIPNVSPINSNGEYVAQPMEDKK
jgi:hypothetical protein